MIDIPYALFGKRIARRLAENFYRPQNFKDLTFAFPDKEGRQYYTYRNLSELPTSRFNTVQSLLRMADAGMDRKDAKWIGEQILKANERALKSKAAAERSDAHAEITVIAKELLIHRADIVPEDVFYDMAAACIVRNDEHPDQMDHTIHLEKWHMLKDARQHGSTLFFCHMDIFEKLLGLSLTSEQNLMRLLPIWSRERKRMMTIQEVFESRSSEQRKTSASSSEGSPTTIKPNTKP